MLRIDLALSRFRGGSTEKCLSDDKQVLVRERGSMVSLG